MSRKKNRSLSSDQIRGQKSRLQSEADALRRRIALLKFEQRESEKKDKDNTK